MSRRGPSFRAKPVTRPINDERNLRKNILFICGSINQTSQMHQIARHLSDHNCRFTPYYADGFIETLRRKDYLNFSETSWPSDASAIWRSIGSLSIRRAAPAVMIWSIRAAIW